MAEKVTIEVEARDNASSILEGIGGAGLAMGAVFATAVVAGIAAAATALFDFANVAAEAEEVQARFNVLVGNSNLAGFTDEMYAAADALSQVTRFDDETILSAQGVLSTFGTIGEEIFPEVTETALDLAEALGTDATSAASTLGRAFADISGGSLGALRGVAKLTDAQKEAAEKMAKTGDVAGAQEYVLDILGEKFGGLAEEMGNTFSGQWTIFQNRIDNMKEALGERLLPVLTPLADMFGDLAEMALPLIGQAIDQYVLPFLEKFMGGFDQLMKLLDAGQTPFNSLRAVIKNMTGIDIQDFFDAIQPGLDAFGAFFEEQGPTIQKVVSETFTQLAQIGQELAAQVLPWLVEKFNEFGAWFQQNGPLISRYIDTIAGAFVILAGQVAAMWQIVQPILDGLISLVLNQMVFAMQIMTGDWEGAWESVQNSVKIVFDAVQKTFVGFANWVTGWLGSSWAEVVKTWQSNWTMFQQIVTTVWGMVQKAIATKWKEITASVTNSIKGLIDRVRNAAGAFSSVGAGIVTSIRTGIENAWGAFVTWITDKIKAIIGAALGTIGGGGESMGLGESAGVPVGPSSTPGGAGSTGTTPRIPRAPGGGTQRINIYGPVTLKVASDTGFMRER